MAMTVIFLAVGFYVTYTKRPSRFNKGLLWAATAVFLLSSGYQLTLGHQATQKPEQLRADKQTRIVRVHIEGMT